MDNHEINPAALPLISYRDRAVLTTELLAQLCGCSAQQLRDNFRSHAGRFVEGKHYFRVEGAELKEFKARINAMMPRRAGDMTITLAPVVSALLLWTERGAARHAKLLHTEQSWEVFESLEDKYFRREALTASDLEQKLRQMMRERDEARQYATRLYRENRTLGEKLERIRDAFERLQGEHILLLKVPAEPRRRAADAAEVAEILALYDAGRDFYEIGQIQGRSADSVRHIVRRHRPGDRK